jgi:hypothetical protein
VVNRQWLIVEFFSGRRAARFMDLNQSQFDIDQLTVSVAWQRGVLAGY